MTPFTLRPLGEYVLLGRQHEPEELARAMVQLTLSTPTSAADLPAADKTRKVACGETALRVWLRSDGARLVEVAMGAQVVLVVVAAEQMVASKAA